MLEQELAVLKKLQQSPEGPLSSEDQQILTRAQEEQEAAQQHLKSQAETEIWLTKTISQLFTQDDDLSSQKTLQNLCDFLDIDNCLLGTYSREDMELYFWDQHQSLLNEHPNYVVPMDNFEFINTRLSRGKSLFINDIYELSEDFLSVRRALENLGTRACALVPIHYGDEINHFIALGNSSTSRFWSDKDLRVAGIIGDVLTMSAHRRDVISSLAASEERFQYAMDASRDGLWDWNLKTNDIFFSPSFLQLLGYENESLPMNFNTFKDVFVHPDDLPAMLEASNKASQNIRGAMNLEIRFRHREGDTVWVYSRAKFVNFDESGKPMRCVGIVADITQFKKTQEQLLSAKTLADEANTAKSEFLARMSHEIRTPMNAIIGMGHLLKDTGLNRTQHDYLNSIDQAANSLLTIINEILDFSKIESGQFALDTAHIDLEDMIGTLAQQLSPKAEDRGLELIYDIDPSVPQYFRGDSTRLSQILGNLIGNSIKFTEQGEIHLQINKASECKEFIELVFKIRDTGIGMSAAKTQSLFDPFTQGDGSSSRKFGGTGLGLTLCKHLVELMDGKIDVQSNPGKGSCFSFTAKFEHSQIGPAVLRSEPRRFEHLRTLVVDDNFAARTIISKTARSIHLNTDVASDAQSAITMLKNADKPYGLVLMDYNMPGINGVEASRLIKHEAHLEVQPSVILVSAHQKDEIFGGEKPAEIDGFIHKPVSQSRLFDAIAETFGEELFDQHDSGKLSEEQEDLLSRSRILLAEDNVVNQKVAIGILKKKGVEVLVANNGREAIEILESEPAGFFDLILMDMEMPEIDGYQATIAIREGVHDSHIPIVAMTAHAMSEDRDRCINCGMDGYITKPVAPELLYTTLAGFLGKVKS